MERIDLKNFSRGRDPEPKITQEPFAHVIELPKGGGAIRSIGEKFAANPVTGSGSMTIPIVTSPSRSGFGIELSLSYDSGMGNGPFGFGWSLSLPSITRKTEKLLPKYLDSEESDVFILSGTEDLVPVYRQDYEGSWINSHPEYNRDSNLFWVFDKGNNHIIHEDVIGDFFVRRYKPRIEGLFARIERWTRLTDPNDVHWRSISKDNILTLYGSDQNSRICDPEHPGRIFRWLISEIRDDKGNAILYRYKAENGDGVDPGLANEKNRGAQTDISRTANRYLKNIYYGNRKSLLDENSGQRPQFLEKQMVNEQIANNGWMFEVVFDYGEHHIDSPKPGDIGEWDFRPDPFSSYRSGFEIRTARLCKRVLMFHHFPEEMELKSDCLVHSTDFSYSDEQNAEDNTIYTFLKAATQTCYLREKEGYIKKSLPPIEFEYTQPVIENEVHNIDSESLENLPTGADNVIYQWIDLHGEGIPGILAKHPGQWFYKRNISPTKENEAVFAPMECVAVKPNFTQDSYVNFIDLAGNGKPDIVVMDGQIAGFFEHDDNEGWQPFTTFRSQLNINQNDRNLKFIDLDGDGHADILITEDNAFVWHTSLAKEGFGPAVRVVQALDEEKGPRIIFADGIQSIYLADMSGDGLTDLVRIRNGDTCYWPNLGYGRFGPKVNMDNAPWFDSQDQFSQDRIRMADIDGSGTADIIYLHRDGVYLYFNQSGNSWSGQRRLDIFPHVDDVVNIEPVDLLGNGTTCLVWSSSLQVNGQCQMRYVNLMGGQKPHLLVKTVNNLGSETHIHYTSSTKFYMKDKMDGKPWITRLPFPVHVVEKVEVFDHISHNRFITRYAYHHGYFDGEEREFRGFGMVEQYDTELFTAFVENTSFPVGENIANESHVPPVLTKTWFHTGAYLERSSISDYFAGLQNTGDKGEYFREPGISDNEVREMLLPDTIIPSGLTLIEEREACRALKGVMLRQEIYALDGTKDAGLPYAATEQNFSIRILQPQAANRHGIFFVYPNESISYQYERNPADPRTQHKITLEVDNYGNILKEAAVGYPRRSLIRVVDDQGKVRSISNPGLKKLVEADRFKQLTSMVTYTENSFTNAIETSDAHSNPLPCESRTYELMGYVPSGKAGRFQSSNFVESDPVNPGRMRHIYSRECSYGEAASGEKLRRLVECRRILYRKNDLTSLCPLHKRESMSLPGESYKLAFTQGLLSAVFKRQIEGQPLEELIQNPETLLGGHAGDCGGYIQSRSLKGDGCFPGSDIDDNWWIPSGKMFFTTNPEDSTNEELAYARKHFFLPMRFRGPFGEDTIARYDSNDLLVVETMDALGNRVTAEKIDYRVLKPCIVSDPNRNRAAAAFDILGMVTGIAVMGKPLPAPEEGDSLNGFTADLTREKTDEFFDADDPHADAYQLLQRATSRIVYDVDRFMRTKNANPSDPSKWLPAFSAILTRESHFADLLPEQDFKIQIAFSYSDGFGREIQKKVQAEPGSVKPEGPEVCPRWVSSGWTIFNNKGSPVRQYEPYFSATHKYEFGVCAGISPVLFYDPLQRHIATLYPDHTYEKVVFDVWQQSNYDANDTIAPYNSQTGDPQSDPDIQGYVEGYFRAREACSAAPWLTWYQQREAGAMGRQEQTAAAKAAAHADTPTIVHFDVLGRPFLTVGYNRTICEGHPLNGTADETVMRVQLDIEGNERIIRDSVKAAANVQGNSVKDELGRIVMQYDYDMLGNCIHQFSMESGERWILNDITGKPIRLWDSRGHIFSMVYDNLRRATEQYVRGSSAASDPRTLNRDILIERTEYGETLPDAEMLNLRTRVFRHFDQAGIITNARIDSDGSPDAAYDFKGNLLHSTRRLITDYKVIADWSSDPKLDDEQFESSTLFDALNRPIQSIAPHNDLARAKRNIIQQVYNEANLLERIDVWLDRADEPDGMLNPAAEAPSPVGIGNIDYDAKGQRLLIDYKNGTGTCYEYDPLTFRLKRLITKRDAFLFPNDCPEPVSTGWSGSCVQNLSYIYDPAGNITHIQDDAQQAVFFRNKRIEPSNDFTYDAFYRLIEATGRELLGQCSAAIPHLYNDASRTSLPSGDAAGRFSPYDGNALGAYTERYVYDNAGNFLEMMHRGGESVQNWTRSYEYEETSLLEDGSRSVMRKASNRLSRTVLNPGSGNPISEPCLYDAHGNMLFMPHLGGGMSEPNMHWNCYDQLRQIDMGGGGRAYYLYDSSGQRVRKVWEKAPGLIEERIYLGGYEIFRRHGGTIGEDTAKLERETLHLTDGSHRFAMAETRTLDITNSDTAPRQMVRYQFGNHLGSASLELDGQAQIISYEEYSPYGSTTYQAVRSQTETPKRYRYTGKERDEESGLYYHVARYYAPWLGRWTSSDPIGIKDGINTYAYVNNCPTRIIDPSGTDGSEISKVAEEALNLINKAADPSTILRGLKVLKSFEVTLNIDEILPVGEKGISPTEARDRAISLSNRHYSERITNTETKFLGTDTNPLPELGEPISLKEDPSALINRRFSDIKEMKDVYDIAYNKIRHPEKLSPVDLKSRINKYMSKVIRFSEHPSAVTIRETLAKLGFKHGRSGWVLKGSKPKSNTPENTEEPNVKGVPLPLHTPEVTAKQAVAEPSARVFMPEGPQIGIPESPGIVELDPKPGPGGVTLNVALVLLPYLAEQMHATEEYETWPETISRGPDKTLARFVKEDPIDPNPLPFLRDVSEVIENRDYLWRLVISPFVIECH